MAKKTSRKNTFPYATFVKDDNDLKGIVAYSLYKKAKIEYQAKLDKENVTSEEYDAKVSEWVKSKLLEGEIQRINEAAEMYLKEYVDWYRESSFPWKNSILASVMVTVVAIALSMGIACYNKFNPIELLKTAANNVSVELAQD
ncbi:MAG: hypothetical protein HDR32_03680 [Treponema sp.]|nr:hypothetical protein [Treponema sp.]